jgi:von Willebrand factor type A domain/Aerotolerance regulator N-terminal
MAWLSALLKSLPFANGAMLLWGGAAVLPIIIHLLSKRKYREVTWAAMEYLLAALRKNARRIRIEQLLLLLIRVAILWLLGLALADPIWSLFPSLSASLGAGGHTHFVLVIDGSYSMDYRPAEKSRFEAACELATQVVENSRQGDGFSLILMADPAQTIIAEPGFDPKDVLQEIRNLRLRHTGGDLSATLGEVEKILRQAQTQHPRLTDAKVCWFTDLGRTTWDEVATDRGRQTLGRLADKAMLVMFDVGQGDVQNLAVMRLDVRESLVTIARDVTIEAEVQNFGALPATRQRAVFLVDDQQVHAQDVDVPADGRATVSFTYRFDTPGEHGLEARLLDDRLAVDNHRWLSLPVREAIRVLCVEGKPEAARYVAYALQPDRSQRPAVRPDVRMENALMELDLSEYDCLFLCNVGRISRDEAGVLYDFVKAGGGLVITLGDQVQADSYNQELGGELSHKRVLPGRLEQLADEAQYTLDPLEYRHPIVAPFARHERAGLLTTPVWKYFRVQPYDKTTAKVALAFQNGDPAIVEEPILRGRSILLATAVSPDSVDRSSQPPVPWTAISTWPSFPPLVQEMLALAVRGQSQHRNLLVGEPLEGNLRGAAAQGVLSVIAPDGTSERVPLKAEGDESQWVYHSPAWSGLYRAQFGASLNPTQLFAVNVNPRESNLERFDPELLPSQFRRDLPTWDQTTATLPASRPTQYFRYLLGLVLVLLLTESFLAWRFGNASM